MQKKQTVLHPEFSEFRRSHGPCWMKHDESIWIVFYPVLLEQKKPCYIAYRPTEGHFGRYPWTVGNRRCGEYFTLSDAIKAHSNSEARPIEVEQDGFETELRNRIFSDELGDDIPILMESFGVDYEAACDAIFGKKPFTAIHLLDVALLSKVKIDQPVSARQA